MIVLDNKKLDETSVAAALQLANPDLTSEVERRRIALSNSVGGAISETKIAALCLVDNPRIYTNPRTNTQQYKGKIFCVDKERGYCVQLVGKHSLFVHQLDSIEILPELGENVNVAYRL